ncbi:hypothetical protein PAHA111176_00765 [Parendozoicomonas haliclonae]|uniref:Uncharacterized protein n=1 Tax=Parendozoicomonas haliclonae TaxID=1960125 RepID=A0A1X7AGK0_9GAMM|nr:hypothetical protein EHSB41UT_00958 [Parendozoicomonas haliclonae]
MKKIAPLPAALIWSCGVFIFLQLLLTPISTLFFELYHLLKFDFLYWGYSAFKAAAVYLPRWEYFTPVSLALSIAPGILIFSRRQRLLKKQLNTAGV